jgi:hypothetical protein
MPAVDYFDSIADKVIPGNTAPCALDPAADGTDWTYVFRSPEVQLQAGSYTYQWKNCHPDNQPTPVSFTVAPSSVGHYKDHCGWSGNVWEGAERSRFRMQDSAANNRFIDATRDDTAGTDAAVDQFAGIVCMRDAEEQANAGEGQG